MDFKKIILPVFIVMVLAQLYVPASMIFTQEDVIKTGTTFKFKTAPVDPYDPFRGKYIRLTFRDNVVEIPEGSEWVYNEPVYAVLGKDKEDFAELLTVSKTLPDEGTTYVNAVVRHHIQHGGQSKVRIEYPFDRFYMEESKAFEAETIYRKAQRDTALLTYALVKVKNGKAVLENVIMDGQPIQDVVKQNRLNQ